MTDNPFVPCSKCKGEGVVWQLNTFNSYEFDAIDCPQCGIEVQFRQLLMNWKEETAGLSSSKRMVQSPHYRQIVAMGDKVIPHILKELVREPDHLFRALRDITGENPVPRCFAGDIKRISQAWVAWGRSRGLLPERGATDGGS